MPDDRIEISFENNDGDNQEKDSSSNEERIVIDFGESEKPEDKVEEKVQENQEEKEEEIIEPSLTDGILASKINSFYKAGKEVNGFYPSDIKFPEGIEHGFREGAKIELNDSFLNSILENNKFIILASVTGAIYFVDRFKKQLHSKIVMPGDSFEKTGLVHNNILYINSVGSLHKINEDQMENGTPGELLYKCELGFYIWSSLNRENNTIAFLEYSPSERKGNIVLYDIITSQLTFKNSFPVNSSLNQILCIIDGKTYFIADNYLYTCDINSSHIDRTHTGLEIGETCFLLGNGNKLYLTSKDGKVYFLDNNSGEFKYTGICEHYINSIAGCAGNVYTGASEGWRYYDGRGVLVYSHEDVEENRIEAVSEHVLVVSRRNKIVFHNLSRLQEAEGFVIKTKDDSIAQEIFSAIISFNEIYTLTKQGVLSSFTNDKLNIHV